MSARAAAIEISNVEGVECTVSKTTAIERLFRRFNNCETSLEYQPRSGGPSIMNISSWWRERQPQASSRKLLSTEFGPSKNNIVCRHLNEVG